MMRLFLVCCALAFALPASGQDADKEPAEPATTPRLKPKVTRTPAPTPKVKAKVTPTPKPKLAATPTPKPKATPKKAAAKSETKKAAPAKAKTSAAKASSTKTPAKVSSKSTSLPKPGPKERPVFRYDPYQLASYFPKRWDLLRVVITPAEKAKYVADAIEQRLRKIAQALTAVGDVIEQRQKNTRSAATALYVIGRANGDAPWYPTLMQAHQAALRSVIQQDQDHAARAIALYEPLRAAMNTETDTARRGAATQPPERLSAFSITHSTIDLVAADNELALAERSPAADHLLTVLQAEHLIREQQKRETLASLAPPPPVSTPSYNPIVSPDTPMPQEEAGRQKAIPPAPPLDAPDRKGVDVPAAAGESVRAAASGVVAFAGPFRGYGTLVIVEHPGQVFSVYGYLREVKVKQGDTVTPETVVGTAGEIGDTGSSGFYFEVRKGTTAVDPATVAGIPEPRTLVAK